MFHNISPDIVRKSAAFVSVWQTQFKLDKINIILHTVHYWWLTLLLALASWVKKLCCLRQNCASDSLSQYMVQQWSWARHGKQYLHFIHLFNEFKILVQSLNLNWKISVHTYGVMDSPYSPRPAASLCHTHINRDEELIDWIDFNIPLAR